MAAQKIASKFRLTVGAGKATPQPPVGSALGQRGLKLMDFCKDFNDRTSHIVDGTPVQVHCASSIVLASAATDWMDTNVQVEVTAYADRTFSFKTALPKSSYFLKLAAGLDKGASKPGQEVAGKISVKHIYEIAKVHGVLRAASCPTPTICHSLPLPTAVWALFAAAQTARHARAFPQIHLLDARRLVQKYWPPGDQQGSQRRQVEEMMRLSFLSGFGLAA